MLTIAAVKAARTKPRAYKIYDERGLFLFVSPSGLKSYRLRFRFGGKERPSTRCAPRPSSCWRRGSWR